MEHFLELLFNGLGTGAIYGLVALALVLIYRTAGLVNLAQGEMAMFSTYLVWQLTDWGLPIAASLVVAMGISFLAGMAIHAALIRPVQNAPELTVLIVTLGLYLGLYSVAGWTWGYLAKSVSSPFPSGRVVIGGAPLTAQSIGMVALLLVLAGVVFAFLRFTRMGLAMRTVASNAESARLVGIRIGPVRMLGWGLAAALGTVAGTMAAPSLFLTPTFMDSVLIYAIAAAALGGLDSALGAVIGGLVIGVADNMASAYIHFIGSDLNILVPLVLIIGVLLVRPQGLFGSAKVARV